MSSMASVLFDLDGVFYVGNEPVPGAVEALEWFLQCGIPHLFLTNTSSKPRSGLVDKLRSIGIDTDESHLLTPPVAAVRWIQDHVHGIQRAAVIIPPSTLLKFHSLLKQRKYRLLYSSGKNKRVFDLMIRFGTSQSPKRNRSSTAYLCPGRPGHWHCAITSQARCSSVASSQ